MDVPDDLHIYTLTRTTTFIWRPPAGPTPTLPPMPSFPPGPDSIDGGCFTWNSQRICPGSFSMPSFSFPFRAPTKPVPTANPTAGGDGGVETVIVWVTETETAIDDSLMFPTGDGSNDGGSVGAAAATRGGGAAGAATAHGSRTNSSTPTITLPLSSTPTDPTSDGSGGNFQSHSRKQIREVSQILWGISTWLLLVNLLQCLY